MGFRNWFFYRLNGNKDFIVGDKRGVENFCFVLLLYFLRFNLGELNENR